jgi:hypothetical protein
MIDSIKQLLVGFATIIINIGIGTEGKKVAGWQKK